MNTSELLDLFVKRGYTFIANGAYGKVYGSPSEPWVIKHAGNDGTRSWLEWCELKTARGEKMRGMPEIDFLISIDGDNYMVGMRRYQSARWDCKHDVIKYWPNFPSENSSDIPSYIKALLDRFRVDCPHVSLNDMHRGNVMYCERTKSIIVTDPSSGPYYSSCMSDKQLDEDERPILEMNHY